MNPKLKLFIGLIGTAMFIGMAIIGVKFIFQAEQNAEKIRPQVENRKNLDPNAINSGNKPAEFTLDNVPSPFQAASETQSASNGKDLIVKQGEFSLQNGQAQIEMVVENQSTIPIKAAHVSAILQINDQNAIQEIGLPFDLPQTLFANQTQRVTLYLPNEKWLSESTQKAQKRKILLQIVSITSADDDPIDYPQTSKMVAIKAITPPTISPKNNADDDDAFPDPDFVENLPEKNQSVEQENTQNENENEPEIDPVEQIIKQNKLPEHNETGVISYQEKSFKK